MEIFVHTIVRFNKLGLFLSRWTGVDSEKGEFSLTDQ